MAAKKPVLFVVDSFFPGDGGAERQALVLAKTLREKGLSVEFVTPHLEQHLPLIDRVEGFKVIRIAYPQIKVLGALILMFNFSVFMLKHRKSYSYVHVHITKLLATCLGVIKPWLGLGVITKISGHAEFTGGVLDNNKFRLSYRVMRFFVKKLDYIQSISLFTTHTLKDCGFSDDRILQIPNGVDVAQFSEASDLYNGDDIVKIGFCGRVEKVKGLNVLIQAISLLSLENKDKLEVIVAGNGSHIPALKDLATSLGVADKFKFIGLVEDVPAYLESIDLYVQPSYAEGLSNSVLEAMSAALPVIASKISGNTDLVNNEITGYLFDSADAQQLSEKIKMLVLNKNLRLKMGANGRQKIIDGYSTNSVCTRLIELYEHKLVVVLQPSSM
jgi:glycosyltransferase involved in cell wall biosynthesis